jgi:hypothetical protein
MEVVQVLVGIRVLVYALHRGCNKGTSRNNQYPLQDTSTSNL